MSIRFARLLAFATFAVAVGACGDETTAPPDNPVAVRFESLARQALASGDLQRGVALSNAAAALRVGVRPSSLAVNNNGASETFDAIGVAMDVNLGETAGPFGSLPPRFGTRSIVAWRGTTSPMQLLLVLAGPSFALIDPPVPNSPEDFTFSSSLALYFENGGGVPWIGITGTIDVREIAVGGVCPQRNGLYRSGASVGGPENLVRNCSLATFSLTLDTELQRLPENRFPIGAPASAPTATRNLRAGTQNVAGLKESLSCAPRSTAATSGGLCATPGSF